MLTWLNAHAAAALAVSIVTLSGCITRLTPAAPPELTPTPSPRPTQTPDRRPAIDPPAWFDQATIYQIFPRSFYDTNGDGVGDLNGIRQKLDYIQSLGVNTLWLNPHYPSTTYHGYDVEDYFSVHPELGTLDDFRALLDDLKARNMRLIVDYVANHASREHPFFKDAYGNPASPYAQWFAFKDERNLTYESFFGTGYLPEWNHTYKPVREYLIKAAQFWLDLGVDGLRCDYARGVEHWFWRELRATVKAAHPNVVLLGEVWDGNPTLLRQYFEDGFDALFDFPWFLRMVGNENKVGDGVINGKLPPVMLQPSLAALQQLYPRGAQIVRFPSNHDTNRIASVVQGDSARMRLMAAASFLMPGIPIIYYGEEIGMRGVKGSGPTYDEFRREPMDWYAAEHGAGMTTWFKPPARNNKPNDGVSVEEQETEPGSLLNFYRRLGALRAAHPALRARSFALLPLVDGCETCFGVWRWSDGEVMLALFNFSAKPQTARLDALVAQAPVLPVGAHQKLLGEGQVADQILALSGWDAILLRWVIP
ncbi:MAG: alpha-amylase family glycosyl hydrolase [Anaerolineae bacterium]|nr:alpha-amylase family glycosyl hydrolase [Thermoflexales bacterium]MDW8396359.1 alpha-amylase family glycosyl hydrolase [Anaerolineae bacterium]